MERLDLSISGAKSTGPKRSGNVMLSVPSVKKRLLDVEAILEPK
jgi:hypothetical protein